MTPMKKPPPTDWVEELGDGRFILHFGPITFPAHTKSRSLSANAFDCPIHKVRTTGIPDGNNRVCPICFGKK